MVVEVVELGGVAMLGAMFGDVELEEEDPAVVVESTDAVGVEDGEGLVGVKVGGEVVVDPEDAIVVDGAGLAVEMGLEGGVDAVDVDDVPAFDDVRGDVAVVEPVNVVGLEGGEVVVGVKGAPVLDIEAGESVASVGREDGIEVGAVAGVADDG